MNDETCANCKHCHQAKALIDKHWIEYYVCTLWLDIGEKKEPLVLTLGATNRDICECFEAKEKKNE